MAVRDLVGARLSSLRDATGVAVSLALLEDVEVVYVAWRAGREEEERWLRPVVGSRAPAYCAAAGQVLLAGLPEDERKERVQRVQFGEGDWPSEWTAVSLWTDLAEVAWEGLAIDDEESALGVQAVAVGVTDDAGRVTAALGLSGCKPGVTVHGLVVNHLEALRQAAEEISGVVGSATAA